jgi:flagellar motor switch protein FliG
MALKVLQMSCRINSSGNMSSRASEMIREDMEFMGPIRLKDVEEVQQRIVDVIRRLKRTEKSLFPVVAAMKILLYEV